MGNDCLMSIDGTDHRIEQKRSATKGKAFASHKYAMNSALQYKLGVDILANNLVWVCGPYPRGKNNAVRIFNSILSQSLEPGDQVEAGNMYVGHADTIKCPNNC